MKIISYNSNGLRSFLKKNVDLVDKYDPDVFALQETRCPALLKCQELEVKFPYHHILESQTKKGYSGVAIYSKINPLSILTDFPLNEEGRVIVFEFKELFLLNAYVPNSKDDLSRLEYRINIWEPAVVQYICRLKKKKPVIMCADFNVAPNEIDIFNPKGKDKQHGFTYQERMAFKTLLEKTNSVDIFRHMYPREKQYTWFSNFHKCREKNVGWRIDHFIVPYNFINHVNNIEIIKEYTSSDHNPIMLELLSNRL